MGVIPRSGIPGSVALIWLGKKDVHRGAEERGVGGTLLFWFHSSAVYREYFRIRARARARERIREEFVYVYVNKHGHGVEPGVSSLPGNISQQGVIGFPSPTIRNPSQGSHQTDISWKKM
ncbi:hypothetical protein GF1_21780 [Desulfolithobacter dissulfuricans]|uniref:Uncharacterized protein n=1 Tax=Desulfolithobacter dissulfuricans TaxID=2795293 RepID=A0A915U638_9BACT|nr:hypothetical protein GF1_21780 [Desulfolithobacter dissulfuricans]